MTAMTSAAQATRSVLSRGRASLATELVDARDRFIASDPGLFRLRKGLAAMLGVGTTAVVELVVFALMRVPMSEALRPVMLGAMIAMSTITQVRENGRKATIWVCAGIPVAAAVGFVSAALADPVHPLLLALFVLISFFAVWVRRFGPRWSTRGFVAWQAYFFTLFIKPPTSMLPYLALAAVISGAWVAFLMVTVLHDSPAARVRRIVTALRARERASVSACLDLLDHPSEHTEKLLRRQLVKASAVGLMFEAQISAAPPRPDGPSHTGLRRWLLDLEIGLEEIAGATVDLAGLPASEAFVAAQDRTPNAETLPGPTRELVQQALRSLGWGHYDEARVALGQLPDDPPAVRRLASGGRVVLHAVDEWTSGRLMAPDSDAAAASEQHAGEASTAGPAADDTVDDGYERVMKLVGDNLPGSQSLAIEALAHQTPHWWSPGRMAFQTRQAIQAACAAALAVTVGEIISPQRFYWAALAAFLTFIGASTAAENTRKAIERTMGTMLGLAVSLGLVELTSGNHAAAVVIGLVCVFFAFYFQPLSYAVMIFFITIVLGQLYELLHLYTDSVMVLRLEETAVGAAAGILASFLVLPVPAGATARVARQQLMQRMATLLDECADLLWGQRPDGDLLATMVQVGDDARLAVSTRAAMLRLRTFGAQTPAQQHLTSVLMACAVSARAVAQAVDANRGLVSPQAAGACTVLADECRRIAALENLNETGRRPADVPDPATQVEAFSGGMIAQTPVGLRRRIRRLAESLTLMTPRGRA